MKKKLTRNTQTAPTSKRPTIVAVMTMIYCESESVVSVSESSIGSVSVKLLTETVLGNSVFGNWVGPS